MSPSETPTPTNPTPNAQDDELGTAVASGDTGHGADHDEVEALRGEIEQLKAQGLIERADLENQRKRLQRDIEQARKFANERLLADLLPVFDSMEAGLATAAADDPLRAGLELTLKQLLLIYIEVSSGLVCN